MPGYRTTPQVIVIKQRLPFGLGKMPNKRSVAPRVGKELTFVTHGLPVVFKEHRRHLERAQVTRMLGANYRRSGKRLQRKRKDSRQS